MTENQNEVVEEFAPELVDSALAVNITYQMDHLIAELSKKAFDIGEKVDNYKHRYDGAEPVSEGEVINFCNNIMHGIRILGETLEMVDEIVGRPANEFAEKNSQEVQERLRDASMATDTWQSVARIMTESPQEYVRRTMADAFKQMLTGNAPTD